MLVLSLLVFAFHVLGATSLLWENKLSEFYDFFIGYNGWYCTILGVLTNIIVILALCLFTLGSIQLIILFVSTIFGVAAISNCIYYYIKGQ